MQSSTAEALELDTLPNMERVKQFFSRGPEYEPLNNAQQEDEEDSTIGSDDEQTDAPFSWIEYSIFLLLGVAMLWAWNMFLAAAPYFQHRFQNHQWILNHFQAAEISVSTVANMGAMLVLTKLQKNASYPKRISTSLILNTIIFAILAISTLVKTSANVYFGFLLIAIGAASLSTGLIQNGLFAFASGFGRSEYTQAIMTGQAVAGVLPPLVQIISVATVSQQNADDPSAPTESPTSALIYFLTATAISILALLAFFYLLRRSSRTTALHSASKSTQNATSEGDAANPERPTVPILSLLKKLPFLSAAVFICFAITMVFPVFTSSIISVSPAVDSAIFIPAAFFVWNAGDLLGRLATLSPRVSLTHYPFALFCIAMARILFIPLYFLCNIKGRGAVVSSDVFYLGVVQLLFGLTNGYLGSECMMGAGEWVAVEEREAAGGFMGLMLVAGLTVGSLASFALGDI